MRLSGVFEFLHMGPIGLALTDVIYLGSEFKTCHAISHASPLIEQGRGRCGGSKEYRWQLPR